MLGQPLPGVIVLQRIPLYRLDHADDEQHSRHDKTVTTGNAAIRLLRIRFPRDAGAERTTGRCGKFGHAAAKRVIFLCMSGGPAQLDTFDYKPQTGKKNHPGSVFNFKRRGRKWTVDFGTAARNSQTCRSPVRDQRHARRHRQSCAIVPATAHRRETAKRPSIGSWINYGLGTENENLPGFISLNAAKHSVYSSEFLPSAFAGTPIGVNGENMSLATIRNITGEHLPPSAKREQLDFIQSMNRSHLVERARDAKLEGVIESMELAFRMQSIAPELLDLSQ